MTAIVLTDGKAGHENQSRAFARALGLDVRLVPVRFKSSLCKALSYLLDRMNILTTSLLEFESPCEPAKWVIGTGSGTFYAAKALARRFGARCGVVLYPRGYRLSTFDCILAPSFDSPSKRPNIVEVPANLVASDSAFYEKGVAAFKERHEGPMENIVGVIVGGPNKCASLTADWMKARLDEVFAANKGAQLCVTTSRRRSDTKRRNLWGPGFRLSSATTSAEPKVHASESMPVDSAVTYSLFASCTNAGMGLKWSRE